MLNISGTIHDLNRRLQNDGTATWTGGDLRMNGGTLVNNNSFTANADFLLDSYGLGAAVPYPIASVRISTTIGTNNRTSMFRVSEHQLGTQQHTQGAGTVC